MEWINVEGQDLVIQWRRFRLDIDKQNLNQKQILRKVAKYWAYVPRGARCVDYYTPTSWPTPWEILSYKMYCENTVSLMIFYTLEALDTFNGDIEIFLLDDDTDEYIAPVVNHQYVLNYEYSKLTWLSDLDPKKIMKVYNQTELPELK